MSYLCVLKFFRNGLNGSGRPHFFDDPPDGVTNKTYN